MAKHNVIGVDLAKTVIQVCILSPSNKVSMNKAMSRKKFAQFLAQQPPSTVVFEACASAHYWSWVAQEHRHQTKIIPAKAAIPFRQGHKTDENDAPAIALASTVSTIKLAPNKTPEQLAIQLLDRSRSHLVDEKTALSNHLRSVLGEFGIAIAKGFASLRRDIPSILEDGENRLPHMLRESIKRLYERFLQLELECKAFDRQIEQVANQVEPCQRLQQLEGVGPIGSNLLYATLGLGDAFKNGRAASSYVGVTPQQHSSGGKIVILGLSAKANKRLRSVLIQGARSVVHRLKEPKTPKEKWLWGIIQRSGHGKAAVALANKNVRTAWAMLRNGEAYQGAVAA